MRRRISCTIIKSRILNDDIKSSEEIHFLNLDNFSNNYDSAPGAVIYTQNFSITKIQSNNYLTGESLDFYA